MRSAQAISILAPVLLGIVVLALWQGACRLWHIPPYLMPSPSDIAAALWHDGPALLHALLSTLEVTFAALAAAVIGGVLVAFLLVQSPLIERCLMPYVVIMQVTPIVAIAPLIIILVKTTPVALTLCAALIAIFPVISNTLQGLRSVDPDLAAYFRMYKASRLQTLFRLRVPSALPMFMAGLRIATGLSLVGAVVAEFVAGTGGNSAGLAYEILQSGFQMDIPRMFAALFLITVAGLALYGATAGLQRAVLRHRA
ncbi:ABC transporter permease [Tanticharoenia sakaeratensis]|uniref:Nitrate/sulfonate/bicarbonate transporter permease protein n=1 Tax=Tanticharoenia sakaeratensis NBRC 103193 TaxID=1231623 RepID=A0A0D6ML48_9PROT|nr:ABC transporter permease [Tanticharoenia sakaeratensis]GAN54347.1 nitrate/sulfonate/bicarbonate transporter permease protein [Tanticharoenia sakaeratensis NBRC 103193]GBQ18876.1 nitrate/sulfonate/bicarbonate transporter permease [Tanticharoenia sakaeratensis NBRC 103193]